MLIASRRGLDEIGVFVAHGHQSWLCRKGTFHPPAGLRRGGAGAGQRRAKDVTQLRQLYVAQIEDTLNKELGPEGPLCDSEQVTGETDKPRHAG